MYRRNRICDTIQQNWRFLKTGNRFDWGVEVNINVRVKLGWGSNIELTNVELTNIKCINIELTNIEYFNIK